MIDKKFSSLEKNNMKSMKKLISEHAANIGSIDRSSRGNNQSSITHKTLGNLDMNIGTIDLSNASGTGPMG